ncbi:tetratricopeptide repeat protein, partial [bacterium]|nr:tetratricopeptide repeat protein [bacterium]
MNRRTVLDEIENTRSLKRWEIRALNLSDADFRDVDCTGTTFAGCAMRDCCFNGADLTEVRFRDCQLDRATWERAIFNDTVFEGCRGFEVVTREDLAARGANFVRGRANLLSYALIVLVVATLFVLGFLVVRLATRAETPGAPAATPEPLPAPKDRETLLAEGVALARAGKFDQALDPLEKAWEKAPGNLESRAPLAQVLMELGKYDEARRHFEEIIASEAAQNIDIDARQDLAECYQRMKKPELADAVYAASLEKYKDTRTVVYGLHLNHAHLRWKTRDFDGAHEKLDHLLKIGGREQQAGVHLLKGLVYKDMGKLDVAQQQFRKVVREFPKDLAPVLDAKVQLAILDIEADREDRAIESLKLALREGADKGQVFNALFRIYTADLADGEEAPAKKLIATMEKMFADSPEHLASIHVEYGKAAMNAADFDAATEHFRKVVELSTDPVQSAWAAESIEEIKRTAADRAPQGADAAAPSASP